MYEFQWEQSILLSHFSVLKSEHRYLVHEFRLRLVFAWPAKAWTSDVHW